MPGRAASLPSLALLTDWICSLTIALACSGVSASTRTLLASVMFTSYIGMLLQVYTYY